MNNPIVSVVVPVYNVKRYLPKCLDSLISQTLKNLEIIAIDDGSTDGSSSLLDTYSSKDERIRVFHVNNGGVSSARNKGLSFAIGKYVGFVDSDDSVEPSMFETMVGVAERTGSDCVQCEFETIYDSGRVEVSEAIGKEEIYGKLDAISALMRLHISHSIWSKLFRRDSIEGLSFFEQWHFAEDFRFITEFLNKCSKVCTIPDVLYHYYARTGSLAHKGIRECNLESLEIYDTLEAIVGDTEPYRKAVLERELKDSFTFFNAAIGHRNIRKELIKKTADRIIHCRAAIRGTSYFSIAGKAMAWLVCFCPGLYIFFVTCAKRMKGVK